MASPVGRYRFSFDIGGTFTDLVLYDQETGGLDVRKELTDPVTPGEPIVRGLRALLEARGVAPTVLQRRDGGHELG